jgi:hypothetical protein
MDVTRAPFTLSVDMIFATSTFWTFIQGFSASFVFVYFI